MAPHDEQRQHPRAHRHEQHEPGEHQPAADAVIPGQPQREDGGQQHGYGLQQAGWRKQAHRLVEVIAEHAPLAVPLGIEAERQPHQQAERRLHHPDVDRRAGEQEQQ